MLDDAFLHCNLQDLTKVLVVCNAGVNMKGLLALSSHPVVPEVLHESLAEVLINILHLHLVTLVE